MASTMLAKLTIVILLTLSIVGGSAGWLAEGDMKSDETKTRILSTNELASDFVDMEAAFGEIDAAVESIRYYQENVKIELLAASSVACIDRAKADLARAISKKISKEWSIIGRARKVLGKAKETSDQKEVELRRAQALFAAKSAPQVALDRAKADAELGRARSERSETILDLCLDRFLMDSDAPTKQFPSNMSCKEWLKSMPDELIEAEAALAELEAANHAIRYWEAMRKIDRHGSEIIDNTTQLAKAITEKAQANRRAVHAATMAFEMAKADVHRSEVELLRQNEKEDAASKKQVDKAKADLKLATAQTARAEAILANLIHPKSGNSAVDEAEANLKRLVNLRAKGQVAETDVETARIALTKARIAVEYRAIVEMRQSAFERAEHCARRAPLPPKN